LEKAGKKSVAEPLPGKTADPAKRETLLRAEKETMSIQDFDQAAKALTELYADWLTTGAKDLSLVGGSTTSRAKKTPAFVSINT
jgi:hypothetical protein